MRRSALLPSLYFRSQSSAATAAAAAKRGRPAGGSVGNVQTVVRELRKKKKGDAVVGRTLQRTFFNTPGTRAVIAQSAARELSEGELDAFFSDAKRWRSLHLQRDFALSLVPRSDLKGEKVGVVLGKAGRALASQKEAVSLLVRTAASFEWLSGELGPEGVAEAVASGLSTLMGRKEESGELGWEDEKIVDTVRVVVLEVGQAMEKNGGHRMHVAKFAGELIGSLMNELQKDKDKFFGEKVCRRIVDFNGFGAAEQEEMLKNLHKKLNSTPWWDKLAFWKW